ncbi:hypothetical protein CP533_4174 [Ophiocordyceps camponoti-saundersi (nom. inval.)]|nr:hypothetical protein CP533_4174 [Ophiocordyceps camponoti-saundersi (nom. inval.)]
MTNASPPPPPPPAINYVLSFVLVGLAWGLTTPFIRRAARRRQLRQRPDSSSVAGAEDEPAPSPSVKKRLVSACVSVYDFVRDPSYSLPLLLNLSGSVWFFLLVGRAELSLTVPIVNTLAFLFTVLGEWFVEGKVISKRQFPSIHESLFDSFIDWPVFQGTASGVVLSLAGIALCVHSKT